MDKEQLLMPEWTLSARLYQKDVNRVYDKVHSIQDAKGLDED